MRLSPILVAAALLVNLGSCASAPSAEAPVYRAIFEQFGQPNRIYLVRKLPPRPAMPDPSTHEFETLRTDSPHGAADFEGVPVQFLSETEYQQLFAGGCDGWKTFHSRYPEAKVLIGLSHVLFRSSHEAAVYLESIGGCLGGLGVLYILESHSGQWRVKQHEHLWVS